MASVKCLQSILSEKKSLLLEDIMQKIWLYKLLGYFLLKLQSKFKVYHIYRVAKIKKIIKEVIKLQKFTNYMQIIRISIIILIKLK